jgi:hypothetical protein
VAESLQHHAVAVGEEHHPIVDHDRVGGELGEYRQPGDLLPGQRDPVVVGDRADGRGDVRGGGAHPDAYQYIGGDFHLAALCRGRMGGELAQGQQGRAPGLGQRRWGDHTPVSLARVEDRLATLPRVGQSDQGAAQPSGAVLEHSLQQFAMVCRGIPDAHLRADRRVQASQVAHCRQGSGLWTVKIRLSCSWS